MEKSIFGRKWLVGKSYGKNWSLLPDSYLFSTEAEASAWIEVYLIQHPLVTAVKASLIPKEVKITEVARRRARPRSLAKDRLDIDLIQDDASS